MDITCPECSTSFDVPRTAFSKGGRRLKCAGCGHIWFQNPPQERAPLDQGAGVAPPPSFRSMVDPIPESVRPEGPDTPPLPPETPAIARLPKLKGEWLGEAAAFMVVLGCGIAGLWAMPTGASLSLDQVKAEARRDLKGQPHIHVSGRVNNPGAKPAASPDLEMVTLPEGQPITVTLDQGSVPARGAVNFTAKIPMVSTDDVKVQVKIKN